MLFLLFLLLLFSLSRFERDLAPEFKPPVMRVVSARLDPNQCIFRRLRRLAEPTKLNKCFLFRSFRASFEARKQASKPALQTNWPSLFQSYNADSAALLISAENVISQRGREQNEIVGDSNLYWSTVGRQLSLLAQGSEMTITSSLHDVVISLSLSFSSYSHFCLLSPTQNSMLAQNIEM